MWSIRSTILGRLLFGLLVVSGFGLLILLTSAADRLGWGAPERDEELRAELPPMPVAVKVVGRETIEITDTYVGIIRPLERFLLGFEISGRVDRLGTNEDGKPMDDGDRVEEGQVLAVLDQRLLGARLKEAEARLEEADSEVTRAQRLRQTAVAGSGAMSETEFQRRITAQAVALAMRDAAQKMLEDATLVSPVDAVISKRHVNGGESVIAHRTVMDLIQVDQVILVVGVPEAYIGGIRDGQSAHVELLARDRFRRKRPQLHGTVHQVAEAADDTTGLFEVEIVISNTDGQLKPGQIGLAHIVVRRQEGCRVPLESVVFRDDDTLIFSVGNDGKAHSVRIENWIEQGPDMILTDLPEAHRRVVVRGQHRLIQGRRVRLVEPDQANQPQSADPAGIGPG